MNVLASFQNDQRKIIDVRALMVIFNVRSSLIFVPNLVTLAV